MALQHDEQGFLLGARIDTEEISGQLESIHDELKAIRAALDAGSSAPAAPAPAPAAPFSGAPVIAQPRGSHGSTEPSRETPIVVVREQGSGTADAPAASSPAPGAGSSAPAAPAPAPAAPATAGSRGAQAAATDRPAVAVRAKRGGEDPARNSRDGSGRFVGKGSRGDDDSAVASTLSGVGERIAGAISEIGAGTEEADPSVKAFNEIAQPLSRGFGKIFGGGQDRKQERWYRRFWREMRQKRREDQAANKTTQRTLKNIELKPEGEGGGSSGILGFVGLLLAPFLGLFSKLLLALSFLSRLSGMTRLLALMTGAVGLLKRLVPPSVRKFFGGKEGRESTTRAGPGTAAAAGSSRSGAKAGTPAGEPRAGNVSAGSAGKGTARGLLKRVPFLGALLGAGFMASDVMASENSEGTRREKDASTGSAVGRGIGGLGGMAGGAAVGAAIGSVVPVVGTLIGGLVGGAMGGFLGDSAGDIIGEKFGLWVNDLRGSGVGQAMLDGWNLTTDFFSSLWQQASAGFAQRWDSLSASMGEAWSVVSAGASALWGVVAGTIATGWESLSGALTGVWTSAVDEMKSGWDAALSMAAAGWETLAGFADAANGWLKNATGVDLKKTFGDLKVTASTAIDSTKDAAGSAWSWTAGAAEDAKNKVLSAGSRAADGITSGAKAVADATGVSTVVNTVKNAASYATGKKALRNAMAGANITDPNEQAAFMAQMDHESGSFSKMEESFNYKSADRLMAASGSAKGKGKPAVEAAMAQGPEAVAELMYGGRMGNVNPGDAHAFRGRGFTQLTGRDNYTAASKALGIDLVNNPDLAADPEVASKVATWYWKSRPGLSDAAKSGDVTAVTKKINGGTNGLADRQAKTQKYLAEARNGSLTVEPAAPSPPLPVPELQQIAAASASADTSASQAAPEAKAVPAPTAALVAANDPATASAGNPFAGLESNAKSAPVSPGNPFGALEDKGKPATASAGNPFAGLAASAAPVLVPAATASPPSIPSVPTPGIMSIAEAPSIQVPMAGGGKSGVRQQSGSQDVPRDLPDRRIAHIVTGAYSGMG